LDVGPFDGKLALTLHAVAALGKFYSEAIESLGPGFCEPQGFTRAIMPQVIVYAVLPQIVPTFPSFTLCRWHISLRMSTVIGLISDAGVQPGYLLGPSEQPPGHGIGHHRNRSCAGDHGLCLGLAAQAAHRGHARQPSGKPTSPLLDHGAAANWLCHGP